MYQGRRLMLLPIQRDEEGAWWRWNITMDEPEDAIPDEKLESEFATFAEWEAYKSYLDPNAVWTWQGGAGLYCGGLLKPVV